MAAADRRPISAIALDLDGTMLDTAGDIAGGVDATLLALGLKPLGEPVIRQFIGQGVVHLLKSAWIGSAGREPDEAELVEGQSVFTREYQKCLTRTTTFYPGALEGMKALRAEGFPLACVTNKPARFTDPLLAAVGISDWFALIISGDTLPVKKPDPGQLLHAARQLNVPADRLLVVGDSMHDLRAARAAGCPIFCVRYGYTDDPDALVALADAGLDSLNEIAPRLERTRDSSPG
jgi:phosphoglycolate phosphatase